MLASASDEPSYRALSSDTTFHLSQFKGGPVLVAFWRSDCAPCMKEKSLFKKIAQQHNDLKIAVVSLQDEPHTLKAFPASPARNVRILLALGKPEETMAAMGDERAALPYSVFLRANGTVCKSRTGLLGTAIVDTWVEQC